MVVKLGEVQSEMTADVKKTEDLKVRLQVSWSDKMKEVPSQGTYAWQERQKRAERTPGEVGSST